ncbi:hypothetical protein NQZ68_016897 [Dissostichus eleginoides]|nr:hypothetical protein NQZ68_016897 [Dissostichus eleginoides]
MLTAGPEEALAHLPPPSRQKQLPPESCQYSSRGQRAPESAQPGTGRTQRLCGARQPLLGGGRDGHSAAGAYSCVPSEVFGKAG